MDYQEKALVDLLVSSGRLLPDKVDALKIEAVTSGKSLTDLLFSKGMVTDSDLSEARAKVLGIPYFTETKISVSPDLLALISVDLARNYEVVPLALDKAAGGMSLLIVVMANLKTVEFIT